MNRQILEVPKGIKFISEWNELGSLIPSGHVIINKQLTGCGFTEWLLRNNVPTIWVAPRKCLLGNKESQHNTYAYDSEGRIIACMDQNLYYAKSTTQELAVDKDLEKIPKSPRITVPNEIKLAAEEERKKVEQISFEEGIIDAYHRFISERKCPKYCVTYDSFRRLRDVLIKNGLFEQFVIAVDEFQVIFQDQRFKADTELEFVTSLQTCKNVIYVSATPMMEDYLDQIDEFKNLLYIQLDWKALDHGRVITPKINAFPCESINPVAKKYISELKSGKFAKKVLFNPSTGLPDKTVESKELVIYVNSIRNMCEIIRQNKLTWNDTCIICADTKDNRKKIRDAFRYVYNKLGIDISSLPSVDNIISTPPKRGEQRKPITLCSKTAYIGSDMYSDCARTLILSDSTLECLSVDITLDLPQIMGRQRMDDNPWKYEADLFYHIGVGPGQISEEEFKAQIDKKTKVTEDLLSAYDTAADSVKHSLAEKYLKGVKSENYRDDYVAVNTHSGSDLKPQMNKLVLVAEKRAFDIQKEDYANRFSVMAAIDDLSNVDLSEFTEGMALFMLQFNSLTQFQDKMKLVCDKASTLDTNSIEYYQFLKTIPNEYGGYLNALGIDYISGHGYQKSKLEEEFKRVTILQYNTGDLDNRVYSSFTQGQKYTKADIKVKLGEIYESLGIVKKGKASDLEQWFEIKSISIYDASTGKRNAGYELIKIK